MVATTISDSPAARHVRLRRPSWRSLYHHGILLAVALAVGAPAVFLVLGSFSGATMPGDFSLALLTWRNYATTWLDPDLPKVILNTAVYVVGSTLFGLALAGALAWLTERTDMPGKIWIYAGIPMTLAMPGMLQAMAWVLLLSPRIGFLNKAIAEGLALDSLPFNVYSLSGMIFVEGLRLVPTAFLMLVPLLRSMDPALEEAAAASGAAPASTLRKVTLALLAPGLLGIVIFQAMTALEVFEIPGVLGLPAGIHVFSTKIYTILNTTLDVPAYGQANALGLLYVAIALVATHLYMRVIAKSERYAIVSGKGYRPRLQRLGRARTPALLLVLLFFLLSTVLPFLVLLYASLIKYLQVPSAAAFASMSLDHYRAVFNTPRLVTVLWNTLYLVVISATATTALSFLISMVVVRSRFWGRRLLDQLAFLPHAIPGLVLGLAMLWVFLKADRLGVALFGTIWSIAIAFVISFISYGTRTMNAAIIQIHRDLEEAASISGAPLWRIMGRVFLPLMMPSFIGVWVWTMLHVVRIAGLPLVLYDGADNQVLAVFIWLAWDQGRIGIVGAVGTMLMALLFLVTLGFRFLGFGRGAVLR